VVVRYAAIGGAFGGREDLSIQHLLALATWKLRRPTAMIWSREESMTAHHKRHPMTVRCRWGARKDGHAVWFSIHGRNKLSVVLDLKRQRDQALALAARADVLVGNFRPGQLERLGLGPEVLQARNPRLVIARISGYGQDGPYRDKPAFGAIGEAIEKALR